MRGDKLNPDLMIGDEVTVIDVDSSFGTMHTAERFKDYVVTAIKQSNQTQETYYDIKPINETDEELLGRMLAGGGMIRREHLYPTDTWMLRKGFLRGEGLNESKSLSETIMDDIPLEQFKTENPEVVEILDRFPEDLQRELAVERKNPNEFIEDFSNYYLNSPTPIEINLKGELNKAHTIDTMSRTPQDVVDVINEKWNTDFESVKVIDPNPDRYFKYAEFSPKTAPPSLMVNGEILYGVARFVAALLRGDETMRVWDITNKENLHEHNQPGINPELEVGDIIRVVEVDGEHANMPDRFGIYKVYRVMGLGGSQEPYYQLSGETSEVVEDSTRTTRMFKPVSTPTLTNAKYLYRGDTWIYANVPMATDVDRKTISEQRETELNPKLKIGDEIIVLDVGVEVKNDMNKPDKYIRYFVTKIYTGDKWGKYTQPYYGINRPDVDVTDPDNPGVYDQSSTHKHLYPRTDTWMFNPKGPTMRYEDAFQPEVYMSDEEYEELYGDDDEMIYEQRETELNPVLEVGDTIRVIDIDRERESGEMTYNTPPEELRPEMLTPYTVVKKESAGHKSQWPFKYIVVQEDKVEEYEKNLERVGLRGGATWERLLYPWIYQWIYAKKPIAISEQSADSPGDHISDENDDWDGGTGDGKPFTSIEVKILNTLHKYLTHDQLQNLSNETPETYRGGNGAKFWNIMKMFGMEPTDDPVEATRASKYAKWAYDNWTEDGDYGNIENPIKVPLKWFEIERHETGSQVEYKGGEAEVLGFDEDDAGERADYDFYSWGGEMETDDYGDYETYDSHIERADFLRIDEGITSQMGYIEIQDLLFNFWSKVGPTLDPDKLKLIGFDMHDNDDRRRVMINLVEYYGDEELMRVIVERLEGAQDGEYEYTVTNIDIRSFDTYPIEVVVDVMINGDQEIAVSTEDGVIDMTLWEANEKAREEWQSEGPGPYDSTYEEVRETVHSDIDILLENLPVELILDYIDFSEPGSFGGYAQEPAELVTEDKDGELEDLVYIDEPREKHIKKMEKGLGKLEGFPIQDFMNTPPPSNESDTTEDEIEHIESIPVDDEFVDSTDDIDQHFKTFLREKDLEYPESELKDVMKDVKNIILKLKYHYNRPRPGQVADKKNLNLNPTTLDTASTPSYPSGHATQGRFIGNYLSDLYPEYREELAKLGHDIGQGRLMAKVHYPSDQTFGIELADRLYEYMGTSITELEEYCPMGRPNKCKIVDYNKLPDMVKEQVMMKKVEMLKADIFKFLSNRFILEPAETGEIKDNEGNYYRLIDMEEPYDNVTLSHLLDPVVEFIGYGIESGSFDEGDIHKGIEAVTAWVSLAMNQKKDLMN